MGASLIIIRTWQIFIRNASCRCRRWDPSCWNTQIQRVWLLQWVVSITMRPYFQRVGTHVVKKEVDRLYRQYETLDRDCSGKVR